MAIYYVDGKKINIPTHRKPFGQGSEGCLYKIGNKLYKIYNTGALNEGFGNKRNYHQSLLEVKGVFKKFILPESLIFSEDGNYAGYVTELVGDNAKKKEGITNESWDKFIRNIKDFEQEIDLLSEYRFLTVDIGYHNSVFSEKEGNLYMIDPGRYHHKAFFTVSDYKRINRMMLNEYFLRMLEKETIHFKLAPATKVHSIIKTLEEEKESKRFSEYFENKAEKHESVHDFVKEKVKHYH